MSQQLSACSGLFLFFVESRLCIDGSAQFASLITHTSIKERPSILDLICTDPSHLPPSMLTSHPSHWLDQASRQPAEMPHLIRVPEVLLISTMHTNQCKCQDMRLQIH